MNSKVPSWLAALSAALALFAPAVARACAMCGLSPGDHQIHAYNTSVLFMMTVPYTIVAITVLGLYLAYRSSKAKRRPGLDRLRHRAAPRPKPLSGPVLSASIPANERIRDE